MGKVRSDPPFRYLKVWGSSLGTYFRVPKFQGGTKGGHWKRIACFLSLLRPSTNRGSGAIAVLKSPNRQAANDAKSTVWVQHDTRPTMMLALTAPSC